MLMNTILLLPVIPETSKQDWGTWAEYMSEDGTGFAKASGSWGTELATSEYASE